MTTDTAYDPETSSNTILLDLLRGQSDENQEQNDGNRDDSQTNQTSPLAAFHGLFSAATGEKHYLQNDYHNLRGDRCLNDMIGARNRDLNVGNIESQNTRLNEVEMGIQS